MDLKNVWKGLSEEEQKALAVRCDTSAGHLRNIAYGKSCGEKLAVALERETKGAVMRWESRPGDWWEIWPELIGTKGAPSVPVAKDA